MIADECRREAAAREERQCMRTLLRTIVMTAVFGGAGFAAFQWFVLDAKQRAIDELEAMNRQMEERLAAREAMIERLGRSRRVAHVRITGQHERQNAQGELATETELELIELDEGGAEIARQEFVIPGDVLFIDGWTVKFDPKLVAQGDPFRGRTLLLLRRVYSELMPPKDGLLIDMPGAVPPGYAAGDIGQFEKQLWENFWRIATDWELAKSLSVRVAQGEAVYKPVKPGQVFELVIDATGGMSLTPIDAAGAEREFAAAREIQIADDAMMPRE
jgi:hypothetical protein